MQSSSIAQLLVDAGGVSRAQNRYDQAVTLFERAVAMLEQLHGPEHADLADPLGLLGHAYAKRHDYAKAASALERALAICEKSEKSDQESKGINLTTILNNLAVVYKEQGQSAKAEALHDRTLTRLEKIYGPQHPKVGLTLNNLAVMYKEQQQFAKAESLLNRALDIYEKSYGTEHLEVARVLHNLAAVYSDRGQSRRAEPLYQRALAIRETKLGPGHPDVALTLNNLGALYAGLGQYAEAEPLSKRALEIRERVLGPDDPDVAISLNNLTRIYEAQGQHEQVETLKRRVLTIWEARLGPDHPNVAIGLNNLASWYELQGRYEEAEPLYVRSLAIREKSLTPDHPDVALTLNNLAFLYKRLSRYEQAEPLFKRALTIQEQRAGKDHPDVAVTLNNLASLYQTQGRLEQAIPLYERALAIFERAYGPEHETVLSIQNNMAEWLSAQGFTDVAIALHKRVLASREKSLGPQHLDVANSLSSLGSLQAKRGGHAEAEPLLRRALAIQEHVLGPQHPQVAISLNNLAGLYQSLYIDSATAEHLAKAEPLLHRALDILERRWGADHPNTASILSNLATLELLRQQPRQAMTWLTRNMRSTDALLERVLWGASEKSRQAYLSQSTHNIDLYLTVLSQLADNVMAREAMLYSLRRKGLLLRVAAEVNAVTHSAAQPALREKAQSLASRKKTAAQWQFGGMTDKTRLVQLQQQIDDLEAELGREVQILGRNRQRVEPEQVVAALQPGEILVDFLLFHAVDLPLNGYKAWQVMAVVTDPQATPSMRLVTIGPLEPIAALIKSYRESMEQTAAGTVMDGTAKALHAALWQPLVPLLANKQKVYLVPDGALHLLPFKALMDTQGRYVGETTRLVSLSTARDLVLPPLTGTGTAPVVVAAPDYFVGLQKSTGEGKRSTRTSGIRLSDIFFDYLPGTLQEGNTLIELLWQQQVQPMLLTGTAASEQAIGALAAPRILHLATHGFFLDTLIQPTELSESPLPTATPVSPRLATTPTTKDAVLVIADPMNRAGLAFAGANAGVQGIKQGDGTDGILTASEAVNLNLAGTDLVVLSACQTGIGDVRNGEGVYGLQRAFQEAGAKAVLSTLWSISDDVTMAFMQAFYSHILRGTPPQEALQATQQTFISHPLWRHPYYWAPFVLVGKDQP